MVESKASLIVSSTPARASATKKIRATARALTCADLSPEDMTRSNRSNATSCQFITANSRTIFRAGCTAHTQPCAQWRPSIGWLDRAWLRLAFEALAPSHPPYARALSLVRAARLWQKRAARPVKVVAQRFPESALRGPSTIAACGRNASKCKRMQDIPARWDTVRGRETAPQQSSLDLINGYAPEWVGERTREARRRRAIGAALMLERASGLAFTQIPTSCPIRSTSFSMLKGFFTNSSAPLFIRSLISSWFTTPDTTMILMFAKASF
jgi:hypothetical protein